MCPNCSIGTQQLIRGDVQIDMCPQCRGVWLDRGELEKILEQERAAATQSGSPWGERKSKHEYSGDAEHRRRGHDDDHARGHRRRSSIFDIFD